MTRRQQSTTQSPNISKLKYHNLCKCVSSITIAVVVILYCFQTSILIFNFNQALVWWACEKENVCARQRAPNTLFKWEYMCIPIWIDTEWREWWQQNHNNSNKQVTYPINSYIICLFSHFVDFFFVIVVSTLVWLFVYFISFFLLSFLSRSLVW